jgi:hypothetical protein
MKLPVHAESAQTSARTTRAESHCCRCRCAEAPAAAAADPAAPAEVAGGAAIVIAVLHSLIEL